MTQRDLRVVGLRCEHHVDPLGIDVVQPRLSWRTETEVPDWAQSAYELEVHDATTGDQVWSTGRVDSDESVLVAWRGPPLHARQACSWRVRVWGAEGDASEWSDEARFEIGLLTSADWQARFVTPTLDDGGSEGTRPSPYLRRAFSVDGEVSSARLYVTALGVYEIEINGTRVGDEVLAPGWSSYDHRLRYRTHDVTDLVRNGENVIGAILADGWARGNLIDTRAVYTDRLALLAQLELTGEDGTTHLVVSDPTWRSSADGPIRAADLYNGETYDARMEWDGWSSPEFDASTWAPTEVIDRSLDALCAPPGPPVRRIEELTPVEVTTSPSGETIVDFGQNLVGWVRIRVRGDDGDTITLRHAEVLDDGELATRMLRSAKATDTYTLRGAPEGEEWEPRFTFHGFRYLGVRGWPGELKAGDVRAVVVHSDMERTGTFECSNDLVNQLHENIVWGMRGNFVDVPTDCPQRSERLGWTGDIQVFGPTAALLYDVSGMLTSWLADLAAEQTEQGVVPYVVPSVEPGMVSATCGWGDVATILPVVLYSHYGDDGVLAQQYDSMRRWVDCERRATGDDLVWSGDWQFGDWLDPKAPPEDPSAARTDPDLLATAFFAHSARLLADAALTLGHEDDAARFDRLANEARDAFRAEFSTPRGRLTSETQTAYAIALGFELLDETQRTGATRRLATQVRNDGNVLGTGFLGTPWLCPALSENGREDLAYRLLLQQRCPSWLYPVTRGATTIWERWDAIRPDGSLNPGEMLSFNHYAFGAIGAWLYHRVAGLAPDRAHPGWKRFVVAPMPGGDLTHASARVLTPYGPASSAWSLEDGRFELRVTVPPNTRATVHVPGGEAPADVGAGEHTWTVVVDQRTLARWQPSLAAPRFGPDSLMAEVASDPKVMDVIVSVGVKVMKVGSREAIGACTVAELIDRAELDDEEAERLLEAVTTL
jgi:alpha-L-rhamnosidase